MSGHYYVGMTGAGAAIAYTIPAPSSVDLTAITTKSLSVRYTQRGGVVSTVTDWTFSSVVAGSMVATHVPNGTEITAPGNMAVRYDLTLDSTVYRYENDSETVKADP